MIQFALPGVVPSYPYQPLDPSRHWHHYDGTLGTQVATCGVSDHPKHQVWGSSNWEHVTCAECLALRSAA